MSSAGYMYRTLVGSWVFPSFPNSGISQPTYLPCRKETRVGFSPSAEFSQDLA